MQNVEILKLTLFSGDGYGRAAVTFRLGSVVVRGAKVFEKEGKRWLSMPGRRNSKNEWIDFVELEDRESRGALERMVLQEYDRHVNLPEEQVEDLRIPV